MKSNLLSVQSVVYNFPALQKIRAALRIIACKPMLTPYNSPFLKVRWICSCDLIERAELDITRVALAQVTDQFLSALHIMEERKMDVAAAFIVIASRLLQIKSEALLPRPPEREAGEEDPGEALARQLRLYKLFKEVALLLHKRDTDGLRTFLRTAAPRKVPAASGLEPPLPHGVENRRRDDPGHPSRTASAGTTVAAPKVTFATRFGRSCTDIRSEGRAVFQRMMQDVQTRIEVVVAFLAMLVDRLVKRRQVVARQSDLFGEMRDVPTDTFTDQTDFDLEFGE